MFTLMGILFFNKKLQRDIAAGKSSMEVFNFEQITCDQGKQIAGFFKGIMPDCIVTALWKFTLLN